MKKLLLRGGAVLAVVSSSVFWASVAMAQTAPDPVNQAITDGQSRISNYATNAVIAVAAVAAIGVGIRLIPKLWRRIAASL